MSKKNFLMPANDIELAAALVAPPLYVAGKTAEYLADNLVDPIFDWADRQFETATSIVSEAGGAAIEVLDRRL